MLLSPLTPLVTKPRVPKTSVLFSYPSSLYPKNLKKKSSDGDKCTTISYFWVAYRYPCSAWNFQGNEDGNRAKLKSVKVWSWLVYDCQLNVWNVDGTTHVDHLLWCSISRRSALMRPLSCTNFTSVDLCKAHCFGSFVLGLALFIRLIAWPPIYMAPSKLGLGFRANAALAIA